MHESETSLQFAFRFAQMDLSALREGDRRNLKEDLWGHFFTRFWRAERVFGFSHEWPAKLTDQQLADLQTKTGTLLREWSRLQSREDGRSLQEGSITFRFPKQYRLASSSLGGGYLQAEGDFIDVFLFIVSMLLALGGGDTLRKCEECRNVFSKHGRRRFCSTRCLGRSTKRRYREKKRKHEGRRAKKK